MELAAKNKTIVTLACALCNLAGYFSIVFLKRNLGPIGRYFNGIELLAFAIILCATLKFKIPNWLFNLVRGLSVLLAVLALVRIVLRMNSNDMVGLYINLAYLLGSSATLFFTSKPQAASAKSASLPS